MTPPETPSWTDANSHDPGIAILELLAYAADALGHRQDAIHQAEKQRRAVFAAAVAGVIAGALACAWLCARRAASDR
jgi:hypothetical protein